MKIVFSAELYVHGTAFIGTREQTNHTKFSYGKRFTDPLSALAFGAFAVCGGLTANRLPYRTVGSTGGATIQGITVADETKPQ